MSDTGAVVISLNRTWEPNLDTGGVILRTPLREFAEVIDGNTVRTVIMKSVVDDELTRLRAELAEARERLAFHAQVHCLQHHICNSDLDHKARQVGLVLTVIANEGGDLYPVFNRADLVEMTGFSLSSVKRARDELMAKHLVKNSNYGQGRGNRIVVELLLPRKAPVLD